MQRRLSTPDLLNSSLAHYRVLGRLGKGGMGEVFLAEDQRLRRRVALKVLPPDLAAEPRHLERFKREAWSIAALNHPNIVTIYSVEEAEGLHFLVLELVEGKTLADLLADAEPMPLDRVLEIALPLTEALEAAHARNVIHRDLKPRNIMVSPEGRIKVLDFGIARIARPDDESDTEPSETSLTRTGGAIGTASYMSPEQIQERPVDRRSDLFSLGIVLYEMATGQHPFRRKGHLATMAAILCEAPPPPSNLVPEIPARFDEIVGLCLAKEPFLRYRGAVELRRDLQALEGKTEETLASPAVHRIASLSNESESSSSMARRGTHSRLPARPRCFGRETEVREIAEAICSNPPPPVPVLGPAGAGKTTIALAALHDPRVADFFGQRRWFIRCDGATGRESLVGAIARGICPEAIPPLEPKIILDLQEAPAVLALDNFETPWERDTAAVEELLAELAAIPGLALVVALRGEQRPFGPSWREAIHAGPLDPDSARKAFLAVAGERYRDDPDLDSLLFDLDGLALAVVLLASQAEGEPDLSILRRLWQAKRTTLLHRAGALDRQQSLEVSVDLSLDSPRMTGESRRLLSILGLLPEGVARQDVEALLPGHGDEAASILRKVGLAFDHGSRLRVLAPIREHVQRSYPPQRSDFDRTVDHYLALARIGERIGAEGGAAAAARLRLEMGNLEPMILAGLERADPVPAIHSALAHAEAVRFIGIGGLTLIGCAREAARAAAEVELEADCARKQGDIELYRAQYDQARISYEKAREIYESAGDSFGQACCLARLADIRLYRAQPTSASPIYENALAHFRDLGEIAWEASCLMGIGVAAIYCSDMGGLSSLSEALALFRQVGDIRGEANCLKHMAGASFDLGILDAAEAENKAALVLFRKVGSLSGEAGCILNLADIALGRGDAELAQSLCEEALALNRRVGSRHGEANCLYILGEAARVLSKLDRAEGLLKEARRQFKQIGEGVGEANCASILGEISIARSDIPQARQWFEKALHLFQKVPRSTWIGRSHLSLAKLAPHGSPERLEHIDAARRVWEEAGLLDQLRSELEAVAQTSS